MIHISLLFLIIILAITVPFLPIGDLITIKFGEYLLHPIHIRLHEYPLLFTFFTITFLILLFSNNSSNREKTFFTLYALSSITVILTNDLISLVIMFELMAISAALIIASGCDNQNKNAIIRYSCIHFLAGTLLLMGVSIQIFQNSSIDLIHNILSTNWTGNTTQHNFNNNISSVFILLALLINCASLPLSSWVTDCYPFASKYGTIMLSAFTTKISLYILLKLFYGSNILLYLGIATALYGIFYSIFENNIRRLLCYNLVGQIGIMMSAVGVSNYITTYGIILHIIISSVYQCLLFMIATAVINSTEKHNLSDFGELFKKIPVEGCCCIIAILTMAAFPGTSSFISKSLILLSITNHSTLNTIFTNFFSICSVILFISVGVKLFWFTFLAKSKEKIEVKLNNIFVRLTIIVLSISCIALGIFYKYYINLFLPENIEFYPYTQKKVLTQLGLILASILFFICFQRLFRKRINFHMDIDWTYRVFLPHIFLLCNNFILYINNISVSIIRGIVSKCLSYKNNNTNCLFRISSLSITVMLSMVFISGVIIFLCLNS